MIEMEVATKVGGREREIFPSFSPALCTLGFLRIGLVGERSPPECLMRWNALKKWLPTLGWDGMGWMGWMDACNDTLMLKK